MGVNFSLKSGSCNNQSGCLSKDGCPSDRCPDFVIRRYDTKPPLKISVEDCEGPLDLQGLVIEMNMWALAKLKCKIEPADEYFSLADNIGFEQIMIGDIIVMDRVRMPERMLVVAFDEENSLVKVQRGYHGTAASSWKKGSSMRIFRVLNAPAEAELVFDDQQEVDGTTKKDVLTSANLVYEWQAEDTCLPGCYWLEFKVLKMIDVVNYLPGGNWVGETHKHINGFFYTGSMHTESSVRLSYDQIEDKYLLLDTPWSGETHLHSDNNNYTGDVHNDGSVILNQTGISNDSISYDENGSLSTSLVDISLVPSFTDESLTPDDFGCLLGEGVEWVRRFPMDGEGFLIRIEYSPTVEL